GRKAQAVEIDVLTSCNTPKVLTAFLPMLLLFRLCLSGFPETVNTEQQKKRFGAPTNLPAHRSRPCQPVPNPSNGPALAEMSGDEEGTAIQGRADLLPLGRRVFHGSLPWC
ncbi:hypothetical protein ACC697_37515, partial [Rhizobium ruizarguesonis]